MGTPRRASGRSAKTIGLTKFNSLTDVALLEHSIRQDLNETAERRLAVLRPLKVVITNFEEGKVEELEAVNNPKNPEAGTRTMPFTREIYVERDDFMEDPPKKFFRLGPGREALALCLFHHLPGGHQERCRGGGGTALHLRSRDKRRERPGRTQGQRHHTLGVGSEAARTEGSLYDRLFTVEDPNREEDGKTFIDHLNPDSLEVREAKLEPGLIDTGPGTLYQFERLGYFCADAKDSQPAALFSIARSRCVTPGPSSRPRAEFRPGAWPSALPFGRETVNSRVGCNATLDDLCQKSER